jgi:hypothetical protein
MENKKMHLAGLMGAKTQFLRLGEGFFVGVPNLRFPRENITNVQ